MRQLTFDNLSGAIEELLDSFAVEVEDVTGTDADADDADAWSSTTEEDASASVLT